MQHALLIIFLLCAFSLHSVAFEFHWEIDETPEGQESATIIEPFQVTILEEPVMISSTSASIELARRFSVYLGPEWDQSYAYRLLTIFKSIPQRQNYLRDETPVIAPTIWHLSDQHIQNDIRLEYRNRQTIVTVSAEVFINATPRIAEIEGVRGRYFSKRLYRAVVRFVTENGTDRRAIRKIFNDRFAVSIDVLDYTELTRHTTAENAGRFSEFKSEELIALVSMLEEYPSGMLKTPGLKYLVRRLDGTPHPLHPTAPAVSWTSAGYIEFMEAAFKSQGQDYIHRLILHEKAHFLWDYLFDDQLKRDWIKIGGWYENPEDADGWSTTQQTEFVSAYAHAKNPNEDMAESISYYIVNPDKLRSRAPAKNEFIQQRVMHGTRYIPKIREDLTFQVYNLYPDYIYPGKIIKIDIKVEGEPHQDKLIKVEIEIHKENDLDAAGSADIRIYSDKGTYFGIRAYPYDANGNRSSSGHILRGQTTLSRYAQTGYWGPDTINISDANGNARHTSQTDFGWKLYIDNPLADCEPPVYVPNSMRLSISQANTKEGEYQIVTARWQVVEKTNVDTLAASINDTFSDTYSIFARGTYNPKTGTAEVNFKFPNYMPGGIYSLNNIDMIDIALNSSSLYFTDSESDEPPQTIEIQTTNPDFEPPELDLNNITIDAKPTNPDDPNGETTVDITFYVKDNISGYKLGSLKLRDPQGVTHHHYHYPVHRGKLYFPGDPTEYGRYSKRIILPVGSVPGTWGLAEMTLWDRAKNKLYVNFTEIVRFEISEDPAPTTADVNGDGEVNILDLVLVANAFGNTSPTTADLNRDGKIDILDLVLVANEIGTD